MSRTVGAALIGIGIILWYHGGTSSNATFINLGIGSIILGLVVAAFPARGYVSREALELSCRDMAEFFEKIVDDLELEGNPVYIPPYENLPQGGVFIPKMKDFRLSLGRLDEGDVFVTGSERETGILISPPPGYELLRYFEENYGELSGTDVGYASSVISGGLGAFGIGSAEVFEEEGSIEVYIKPLLPGIRRVWGDPVSSAVLLGIAMAKGGLISVEDVREANGYLRLKVRMLGSVEEWL
ncbi:hypothetical protein [Thermococcus sp.]